MYQTNEYVTIYLCRCQTTVQSPWYCITASIMAYATNMTYLPLVANARRAAEVLAGCVQGVWSWADVAQKIGCVYSSWRRFTAVGVGMSRSEPSQTLKWSKGTVVRDRYSRVDSNIEVYPIPFRKSPLDSCPPIYSTTVFTMGRSP